MASFTVDLEEGDLSDFWATVTDGGDLSATEAAALYGTYGMQCVIDDTTSIYGTLLFNDKTRLRFGFYFDPNSLTMASGDNFAIAASGTDFMVRFTYDGSNYKMYIMSWNDSSTFDTSDQVTITDEPHWIECDFKISSGEGADDGFEKLWIDTVDETPDAEVADLDNDTCDYDSPSFGAVSSLDAGTSGTFYMDHICGNDDGTEIGPPGAPAVTVPTLYYHYRHH